MATIVGEILSLVKGMIFDAGKMTLLSHRMKTLKQILTAVEAKLSKFEMHLLSLEDLNKLEVRLFQLRPVLTRLNFRKDGNEVEKLQIVAQAREEIRQYDSILGRLRLDLEFLRFKQDRDDPVNKLLSEGQRQKDVKEDAKEIIKLLRNMFGYRKEVYGYGNTAYHYQLAQELKDCIHENEKDTWKHAIFLNKIEPKLFALAQATVELLDESYFDQSATGMVQAQLNDDSDVVSVSGHENSNDDTLERKDREDETEAKFLKTSKAGNRIGAGSFGEIIGASWNGIDVALRPIPKKDNLSLMARAELRNEALMWKDKLINPSIVQFHGFILQNFQWYLILEKCDTSLYDVLHVPHNGKITALESGWRDAIVRGIARGLRFLHENNVLHTNLRPNNVLIGGKDGHTSVKLSSFGMRQIRKEITNEPSYDTDIGEGVDKTKSYLPYMAPELHINAEQWSTSADIYSFGIILWETSVYNKFPFAEYRNLREAILKGVRPRWEGDAPKRESVEKIAPMKKKGLGRIASRKNVFNQETDDTFAMVKPSAPSLSSLNSLDEQEAAVVPNWLKSLSGKCWEAKPFSRPRAFEVLTIIEFSSGAMDNMMPTKNSKKKSVPALDRLLDNVIPGREVKKNMFKSSINYTKGSTGELLDRISYDMDSEDFVQKALFSLVNGLKEISIPQAREDLKASNAIEILAEVLKKYPNNSTINVSCFRCLRMTLKSTEDILLCYEHKVGHLAVAAMSTHSMVMLVHFFGALILGNLALGPREIRDDLFNEGAVDVILDAMHNHADVELIQRYSCWTLANFLRESDEQPEVSQAMVRLGMPEVIKSAMENHSTKKDVQLYALGALLNLANCDNTMVEVLLSLSMHKLILPAMEKYTYENKIQEYGCCLLNKFSAIEKAGPKLMTNNAVEILIIALSSSDSVNVSHNAWRALHSLCDSTMCIHHIVKCMRNNLPKASVQINGCVTLKYVAQILDEDHMYALEEFGALDFILREVMAVHHKEPAVMVSACSALKSITTGAATNAETLINSKGLETVISVMKEHPHHIELQEAILGLFAQLVHIGVNNVNDKYNAGLLGKRNALQKANGANEVFVTMVNHYSSVKVQVKGLYVLSELASWEEYGDAALARLSTTKQEDFDTTLIDDGALHVVQTSLNAHRKNVTVQDIALATLVRLAHNDAGRQQILARGAVNMVIENMEHYASYSTVLAHCGFLLERVLLCDMCRYNHEQINKSHEKGQPESFFWTVSPGLTRNPHCQLYCEQHANAKAIQLLFDAMKQYPDVPPVQKACSKALRAFAIGSAVGHGWVAEGVVEHPEINLSWFNHGEHGSYASQKRMPRLIGSQLQRKNGSHTKSRKLFTRSTRVSNQQKGGNRKSRNSNRHKSKNKSSKKAAGTSRNQSNTYSQNFGKAVAPPPGLGGADEIRSRSGSTAPGTTLRRNGSSKLLLKTSSSNNLLQ